MLNAYLTGYEMEFVLDMALAFLCGVIIGGEREIRGKDAGIGTHTLVLVGSMLFTFLSKIVDPLSTSRIAAQVITGIGFLGAGLILHKGNHIQNLTTAASIFYAAAIGMAIGFNYYLIAIIATLSCIIITRFPNIRGGHLNKE